MNETLDEDNQNIINVAPDSGQVCLAGLAQGVDTGPLPNRRVLFEYRSLGSIKTGNQKRVVGTFEDVALTLTIEENGAPVFGPATTTSSCKLKGRLQGDGDHSKVRLKCDLGEDFSAFGSLDGFLDDINGAFPKSEQKHIKVNTDKGKLRVYHNGNSAPGGAVELDCDLGED